MYIVDSNFFGTLAAVYPIDVFPALWSELETPLFSAPVYFHQEVEKELEKWSHPQYQWYSSNRQPSQILTPDDEELMCYQDVTEWVAEIRQPTYRTSAVDEFLAIADSWIVASACRHRATIVTNEVSAPTSLTKVKIPDVAAQFSVPCMTALEFIRHLGIVV